MRLDDIELQHNHMLGGGVCSPRHLGITSTQYLPSYFSSLTTAKHRFAFIKARFNAFPSGVMSHRFSRGRVSDLCSCDELSRESLLHIVFICPLYSDVRRNLLSPLVQKFSGLPVEIQLTLLLQDSNPTVTLQVARYLTLVLNHKRRNGLLQES